MLLDLEKAPAVAPSTEMVEHIYREAHSLKGAARAVDQSDVEAICQALESVFSGWKRGAARPSPEGFDTLHNSLDTIRAFLSASGATPGGGAQGRRDELLERLGRLESQKAAPSGQAAVIEPEPSKPRVSGSPPADLEKSTIVETVRISTAKLEERLLQAEELLAAKASLAQRVAELRELTASFDQWKNEWRKVAAESRAFRQQLEDRTRDVGRQPGAAAVADFLEWNRDYLRSLENKVISLSGRAQQDHRSIGKQVDDLLDDSKRLLMLPFSDLAAVLPKLVRDLSRDQGKEVDLVVRGADVEIDKRILEEIKDPLIHILRNCIDHGVEGPADRVRQQKPARATITIAASRVNGSKVEIVISDDGAGVDLDRVKESAVRQGILSAAGARGLSDAEALALTFRSEISSSPRVTEISGRGLGMTIVRAKTLKLGGKVSIESRRHVGTTLRMLLPTALATFRGVLVTAGDRVFVVPTVNVERVFRVKRQEIRTVENRETINFQDRPLSLVRLAAVLELPIKSNGTGNSSLLPIVVLIEGDERIAFAVDGVLHEEEVLVKPLRKPLVRLRNVAGAAVLSSGKAAPVLRVSDLMKSARASGVAAPQIAVPREEQAAPAKRILVVEDSITSRMLLKGILESAGYQVKTAVDGIEAFTMLREDRVDLVVSDVEMPRLNGFELTASIRADVRLAELPVVLVTALESREERERGIDAGANAYIVKSSFDQSNLLEVVRRLA